MPRLDSQKTGKTFSAAPKASLAYGDQFLAQISPGGQPDHSAWNLIDILYPQLSILGQAKPSTIPFFCSAAVNQEGRGFMIVGWPDRTDPFTQADLLDREEDQVRELIVRIRTSLSVSYAERLVNRLLTLFNDAKEEDSASLGIAVGSLRTFYDFLQLNTNLKYPTISLSPEYNIYASWKVGQNRLFSVHFLPNRNARFVIFKPNDRHPELQIRISGTATTDVLMETVCPHNVCDWILE
jgi:hypothetical protein